MIKSTTSDDIAIEKVPNGSLVLTIDKDIRTCCECDSQENIIGYEVGLKSDGKITVWFFCSDHIKEFDYEVDAIKDDHLTEYAVRSINDKKQIF